MATLTKFTENVNNIQALSDRPNTADGLTSHELKERFDKAGSDIKDFLNNTLIPEIEEEFISDDDIRLKDSRKCNNQFDSPTTARDNLKIKTGTSLPGTVEEDCIFLVYEN
mgnify:FL=1